MVEGKDVRPTQPAKAEGIELVMYPLNPDGSWRNGIAPPQPQRTLRQVLDERRGQRPLGRVGEVLLSGRLLENHRELQQFAATETLKTLTIRQTLPEERRRIEVITSRNGGPGIIVRHIDGDQDSSENIVFLRGTRN